MSSSKIDYEKDIISKTSFKVEGIISIVTQPECPKCGLYGRFSDVCCSACGAEPTSKEYIGWF